MIKKILQEYKKYEDIKRIASEEELEMIKKQENKYTTSDYRVNELKELNRQRDVMVFIENRCGDAATILPFLNEISKINSNVELKFYRVSEYEEFLKAVVGDAKIPTVLFLDENKNIKNIYKEFPKVVIKEIENNPQGREEIVKGKFREKVYNFEIQKEFLDAILD